MSKGFIILFAISSMKQNKTVENMDSMENTLFTAVIDIVMMAKIWWFTRCASA